MHQTIPECKLLVAMSLIFTNIQLLLNIFLVIKSGRILFLIIRESQGSKSILLKNAINLNCLSLFLRIHLPSRLKRSLEHEL